MAKKRFDPKRTALLDAVAAAEAGCERWYARPKRAFNRLEKERQRAKRATKAVVKYDQNIQGGATA